jgi:Glycosyl transferases group 1
MLSKKITVFATKGKNSNEESRILELLAKFEILNLPFDPSKKLWSFWQIIQSSFSSKPQLIVMEGTGIAGGIACLFLRLFFQVPYVVSSGDAVAPFISAKTNSFIGYFAYLYERVLCQFCSGFIGWTPYLVGRALTFGAKRGVTAAGWSDQKITPEQISHFRFTIRNTLGIPQDAIVYGIVGSLAWTAKYQYCYGVELVRARLEIEKTKNIYVVIAGDGTGTPHLKNLAGALLGDKIILTGSIPSSQVLEYLSAMDVGSLPQSLDGVGSFRYTTKISEYLAAKLPIAIGQVPMTYDLLFDWSWSIGGGHPWNESYINEFAALMENLTHEKIKEKQNHMPFKIDEFDFNLQCQKVTRFIEDLINLAPKSSQTE